MTMALTGVPLRSTLDHSRQPGVARSRLNAYVMRDMLVTQLIPQKNWPIVEMMMTVLKKNGVRADSKIAPEKPAASLMASTSVAANRNASSTIQPPMADQKMDCQRPLAAARPAPLVSSDTWAHASNPVIVYCVSRNPSGKT